MSTEFFVYIQLNVKTVLFQRIQFSIGTVHLQIIQFSMSTKLNGSDYYNVSLTIQINIRHKQFSLA